jgi:hypothetical protein
MRQRISGIFALFGQGSRYSIIPKINKKTQKTLFFSKFLNGKTKDDSVIFQYFPFDKAIPRQIVTLSKNINHPKGATAYDTNPKPLY